MKKSLLIHPEELSEKWIARAKEVGCDILALHPVGGPVSCATAERLGELCEQAEFRALIDKAIDAGLEVEYELHAAEFLLPRVHFETHPEYFREDENGVRTTEYNFCVSEQGALDLVGDRAVWYAKRLYRSNPKFYFWMDDIKGGICHCERCKGLSASDQQLTVMNYLVKRRCAEIPGAKLAYLAYHDFMAVPQTVKPEDGIFLEYAPIERDFTKPVSDMPKEQIENLKALLQFFGEKDSKVLEYWFDNSFFSKWTKPPARFAANGALFKEDIAFYRGLGFEDISSFACYLGEDYEELYGEADISVFQEI